MKKWYNFETSFRSLADDLSVAMKREDIYYERSGAFGNYHFEIYATPDEAETISDWLDVLSIQEVRA